MEKMLGGTLDAGNLAAIYHHTSSLNDAHNQLAVAWEDNQDENDEKEMEQCQPLMSDEGASAVRLFFQFNHVWALHSAEGGHREWEFGCWFLATEFVGGGVVFVCLVTTCSVCVRMLVRPD